jgi:hypothetical protein
MKCFMKSAPLVLAAALLAMGCEKTPSDPEPTTTFLGCSQVQGFTLGTEITAEIKSSDCVVQFLYPRYAHVYRVEIDRPRTLEISVVGLTVDPSLILYGSTGAILVDSEDSAYLEAYVKIAVSVGTYYIVATSDEGTWAGSFALGRYTLRATAS